MTTELGMEPLDGKVAVITGAASGMGFAMAERFAADGMRIVLADVEKPALDGAAERLRSAGHEVLPVLTDVAQAEDLERLARTTYDTFGAAHVLCNNAGDWRWVIDVNLWGVIHGIRAFVPRMLAQGDPAHVVNTASVIALLPILNKAAYAASKAGVLGVSEALQVDLDADRAPIGVSVLLPGFIPTRITESDRNRPGALAGAAPRTSASSIGGLEATMTAADVAGLVLDAIKRRRFWVLTHPAYQDLIVERARAVGTDAGPVAAPIW
jgi:NAD(P)-dependent dehydrogenase (short-subunit alcohol dehydrogenase family)